MEIGSALAILGSVSVSRPMLERLLGPSFDYLGDGLRELTERRAHNIGRIVAKAVKKAEGGDREGEVPSRVIRNVFDEGSFSDDELTAEYLAGVLASSKSPHGRDDRGVALSSLVNRLSSYTLRTHYILYTAIRHASLGSRINVGYSKEAKEARVFLGLDAYFVAMGFDSDEDIGGATDHALFALVQEQLIGKNWLSGSIDHIQEDYPKAPSGGIVCDPTFPGTELFLWAHGKSEKERFVLFDPEEEFEFELDLDLYPEPVLASSLKTSPEPNG